MKKLLFIISCTILAWTIVEGGCSLLLWSAKYYKQLYFSPLAENVLPLRQAENVRDLIEERTQYIIHDPLLGWRIKPNGVSALYQANAQGMRGDREYAPTDKEHRLRIASFGDSFTHGDEVPNSSTWQAQLEELDLSCEVLNFGVGGYGPDQSYMRYISEGKLFHPRIVLIGFMAENIRRSVNVFRPFYAPETGLVFSKPRYLREGESLLLSPNPLSSVEAYKRLLNDKGPVFEELGTRDWYYQHRYRRSVLDYLPSVRLVKILWYELLVAQEFSYKYESEAVRLSLKILTQFADDVEREGSMPIVVLFTNKSDLEELRAGRRPEYTPFKAALMARHMKVIDLAGAFECDGLGAEIKSYFESGGHYSASANKLVARYLREHVHAYLNGHKDQQPGDKRRCGIEPGLQKIE